MPVEDTTTVNDQLDEIITDLLRDGEPPQSLADISRVRTLFQSHILAITLAADAREEYDPATIWSSAMEVLFDMGFYVGRDFERRGYRLPS